MRTAKGEVLRNPKLTNSSPFRFWQTMRRCVEHEWLDDLPGSDPRAIRSRRDIARIGRWMGNIATTSRLLKEHCLFDPPGRLVDLACGNGMFALKVAEAMSRHWPGVEVVLVDCHETVPPETQGQFSNFGWKASFHRDDVFDWVAKHKLLAGEAVMTSLFLHQLADPELTLLLGRISERTTLFLACEPRRSRLGLLVAKLIRIFGCNEVTRHDCPISIRAGFRNRELSELWPARCRWTLREGRAGVAGHFFLAKRNAR